MQANEALLMRKMCTNNQYTPSCKIQTIFPRHNRIHASIILQHFNVIIMTICSHSNVRIDFLSKWMDDTGVISGQWRMLHTGQSIYPLIDPNVKKICTAVKHASHYNLRVLWVRS